MSLAALVALALLSLGGCAQAQREAFTAEIIDKASVPDLGPVRYWGDKAPPNIDALAKEKLDQTRAARPEMLKRGGRPELSFLAISGGGADGAFASGVLVGWSASGKRPEFDIVTGISTGALAAPFAFLGPRYDTALKEVYTRYSTQDLVRKHAVRGLLGGESLASNAPLASVIAKYVDRDFIDEVAREHSRGRRLLIGTTSLDAQRPVIWDMGKIAWGRDERALSLFRNVLLASAAIPGLFPPVFIETEADGKFIKEMHVDGGTTNEVFLLPSQINSTALDARLGVRPVRRAYIIRNGRVDPEFKVVQASTMAIAGRSISTLIKAQGIGDLYQLYDFCRRNKIDYNLAYIPGNFPDTSTEPFDRKYMNSLFDLGYKLGSAGTPWKKTPPRHGAH
ncbi:MAG: patatin-like phospholipase family protein [Hyphomicrobiales bacterium]